MATTSVLGVHPKGSHIKIENLALKVQDLGQGLPNTFARDPCESKRYLGLWNI